MHAIQGSGINQDMDKNNEITKGTLVRFTLDSGFIRTGTVVAIFPEHESADIKGMDGKWYDIPLSDLTKVPVNVRAQEEA